MSYGRRAGRLAVSIVPLAFVLGACGPPTVSSDAIAKDVSSKLAAQTGSKPTKVDCPADLKGEVGNKVTCAVSVKDLDVDITVEVTKVDGDKVATSLTIDDLKKQG